MDSFGFQKSDFVAPFTVGHQPVFVLEPHEDQQEGDVDTSSYSKEL